MSNESAIMGKNYVRPPTLKFTKKDETDKYTEYEIETFKDSQEDNGDNQFTKDIDSIIFCKPLMRIRQPKESFMKENDKSRFAYAFGMFPNPKTKKASYLDGCILGALGLRRQKTHADIICFVTPDITKSDRDKLEIVFDEVKVVPYISPYDMPSKCDDGNTYETIKMDSDIFKNCPNYTALHPYAHVFFKLHIFNPELFPYEKVCFVDSDLVPLNFYDSLFMIDTPAGWLENRKKQPWDLSFHWDRCDFVEHGELIPKILTDIEKPGAADINAGLLLIEPDEDEYNDMIRELTSPTHMWMGPEKIHKGFFTFDFDIPSGRKFIESSYCYPEQNYLTKRYSGEWTYIEWAFASWSLDPCNSMGIHLAAFNPKPWFKQPAGMKIDIKDNSVPYFSRDADLFKPVDIPKAFDMQDKQKYYENISYSYEIFNDLVIWGLIRYPELCKFFFNNIKICGKKTSFDRDIFDPINEKQESIILTKIDKHSKDYDKLTVSQKHIYNLIKEQEVYIPKIKDKYLNVCKTKRKDKQGNAKYDETIITYPEYTDISISEKHELMQKGLMPFGKYKGLSIDKITDKEYITKLKTKKTYKENKEIRDFLDKNLFGKEIVALPKGSKTKKTPKKTKRNKSKNRDKQDKYKNVFIYFYIPKCKYCVKFEKTWEKLTTKIQDKNTLLIKVNGRLPKHADLVKKMNISSYPTIVLVNKINTHYYDGKRMLQDLYKFYKEHS